MISVAIMINGNPIMARSAVNQGTIGENDLTLYKVDDGSLISHDPDDGAVELAKMMLDTIEE